MNLHLFPDLFSILLTWALLSILWGHRLVAIFYFSSSFFSFLSFLIRYEGCVPDQTRQTYYTAVSMMAFFSLLFYISYCISHIAYNLQDRAWFIGLSTYSITHT